MKPPLLILAALVLLAAPAWAQQHQHATPRALPSASPLVPAQAPSPRGAPSDMHAAPPPGAPRGGDVHAPTTFTLRSGIAEGRMVFLGVGGDINGQVNPTLNVHEGETVQINLINGEGA